jgi:hypothetical protein
MVSKTAEAEGNPVTEMHWVMLCEQDHDTATRDKFLTRVKEKAVQFHADESRRSYKNMAALAGLIADDLAQGGKGEIDLAAAASLNPQEPFEDINKKLDTNGSSRTAFWYLLGSYLDMHGKPELAIRCWKLCLTQSEFMADWHRTLSGAELIAHGVQPDAEEVEKSAAKSKSAE